MEADDRDRVCATSTHSPSARQGGRKHGGGKTQLPLCTGFSVWKVEITPPIRKGLEGFVHRECEGLPGTRSQKRAPAPSACSKMCLLSLGSTLPEGVGHSFRSNFRGLLCCVSLPSKATGSPAPFSREPDPQEAGSQAGPAVLSHAPVPGPCSRVSPAFLPGRSSTVIINKVRMALP